MRTQLKNHVGAQFPGTRSILRALPVLFLSAFLAHGQETRGTITGRVADPQGAAVVGAQVQVKSMDTNVVYPTTTNESGIYVVQLLPPGTYSVVVTQKGFKRAEHTHLQVRMTERVQDDVQLQIGGMTESVEVVAQAALLETATASREQVVSQQAVAELPMEGRNSFLTSTYTAGVYFGPVDSLNSIRPFDNGGMDGMQINGGLTNRNNFTINGLPDTANEGGNAVSLTYVPPPDAVREVSVQTNSYDSEYGHTGGGTINVNLKSGSNQIHGAAYEYNRNNIFIANRWENNASGVARPAYHWNQPGAEIDGPVYIPKLYNGKNKTFFMFSWERIKDILPQPYTASVPTPAQQAGNFSTTTSGGNPITIYDPLTTTQTSSGVYTRQPFAGNIIPASRINPVGAKIMSYYPASNQAGTIDHLNNFFYGSSVVQDLYDVFSTTVDENINDKNRMSFSYFRGNRHQIEPTYGFSNPAASPLYLHYRTNNGGSVNYTATLNPTTVLDFRYGYERHNFAVELYAMGFDPTQLGFPSSLVSQLPAAAFPQINVTNYTGLAGGGTTRTTSSYTLTGTHATQVTLSKLVNKHSFKVGSQFNVVLNNYNSPTSMTGIFTFDSTFTQNSPLVTSSLQGNGFAAMLLGYPTSGGVPNNPALAYSSHYFAVFAQDDWRVTPRLTINMGLRWDVETPLTERYNRQNDGFSLTAASPLQVPGYNLTGGLLFDSSSNRTPFSTDYNNVQPRIGAAFKLNEKTVLRGGFGVYYLPTFDTGQNNGFAVTTPYTASNDGNATPATNLSNPFPTGLVAPSGSSKGLATLMGTSITFSDPARTIPYNLQFSFGVQRQLPGGFVGDVSYVGSRTHEIEVSQSLDAVSTQNLALGTKLNTTVANPFAGLLPGTSLNGSTITVQQSLLPYPQFTGVTEADIPIGHTWYNALQVRLERRFSSGLFFLVSYTNSKNMQATSYLNAQDGTTASTLASQLTTTDQPQNIRISGGYTLPFFKNGNKFARAILGGWQVNTIVTYFAGVPVAAPASTFSAGIDPNVPDPNHLAYFNTCYLNLSGVRTNCSSASTPVAWIQQPSFTLNTLSAVLPNIRVRRPPLADMSIFKTFPIHERLKFQLRAEAFNVTNTVYFPAPNTTLTSAIFGQTVLATGGFSSTSNDPRAVQLSARIVF
jgi:hypothetical protein